MPEVNAVMQEWVDRAISAIRHVVQEHGDQGTRIGQPGDPAMAQWFGSLLGIQLPPSYLGVLEKHDGALVELPLFSLMESVESIAIHRERWTKPALWPVAEDGCGNYYVLANSCRNEIGESPVGFIDSISKTGPDAPERWVASNFASFVFFFMTQVCAERGCSALLRYPSKNSWPFDPDFVAHVDPGMEDVLIKHRL